MLAAALAGGRLSQRLRLPRIVGWLLAGLALKWLLRGLDHVGVGAAGALLDRPRTALMFLKRLALTVVMFSIGLAFELHNLRRMGRTFLRLGAAQTGAAGVLTVLACGVVGVLVGAERPVLSAGFMGIMAVAVSPAATLLTLRQYEAKGHTTDDILMVTGFSAVAAIFLFDLWLLVCVEAGWVTPPGGPAGVHLAVLKLLAATAGSLLTGIAAGLVLSMLHVRSGPGQAPVALLAVILIMLVTAPALSLDYLLVSLVAGVTFINLAPDPGTLEQRLSVVGAPLFALLFVIAGFLMDPGGLFRSPVTLGLVLAYVAARAAGKVGAGYLVARRNGREHLPAGVGAALLCHAGVALGLITSLEGLWAPQPAPEWAGQVRDVVMGSIALFELLGPLLLKRTIVAAGEVKAIRLYDLPPAAEGAWGRLWEGLLSLLRRLGVLSMPAAAAGPLRARHVMRTNVKLLPASADMDEVLRFIERSRLDHFPVVDAGGRFVGTISLADVRDLIYQPQLHDLVTAQDLLEDDLVTAGPEETLEELFGKFRDHKARDLIILDPRTGTVVGIVEQRDVLRAMHVEQTGQPPPEEH